MALLPLFFATVYAEDYDITSIETLLVNSEGAYNQLVHLENGITVLAYDYSTDDGVVSLIKTFDVSSDGIITLLDTKSPQVISGVSYTDIVESRPGIIAVSYLGDSFELKTFNVNSNGTITDLSAHHHQTGIVYYPSFVKVDYDTIALSYFQHPIGGTIKTFDIDSSGL